MRLLRQDAGSAPVEFVLVGSLLTVLTLAVLQVGVVMYARNVATDAAVEGAYRAALADATLADGVASTREILHRAIGAQYAEDVTATHLDVAGVESVQVTVRAPLPVVALLGLPGAMEVIGIAPVETLTLP